MKLIRHKAIPIVIGMLIPCLMLTSAMVFVSCSEDGDGMNLQSPNGPAKITYIRLADPASADSLIVAGNLGTGIVLVGENLGGTREIWFNDKKAAAIAPTWVTNNTVFVSVPNTPPNVITNTMYVVDANQDTLKYPFEVRIGAPVIARLKSEWVPSGEDLVIEGDFFFAPIKVTLPGGSQAVITSLEQQTIRVAVPDDIEAGNIMVETNFGEAISSQVYKDARGIFGTMEPDEYDGNLWHKKDWFSSEVETPEVPSINGYYIRIDQTMTGGWGEWFVGNQSSDPGALNVINTHTQNIPEDAIANPSKYSLKFELFTVEPTDFTDGWHFYLGTGNMGSRRTGSTAAGNIAYEWIGGVIDTEGEWETISIPMADIMKNNDSQPSAIGYGFSFFWWNFSGDHVVNCAIDNIRVVPN